MQYNFAAVSIGKPLKSWRDLNSQKLQLSLLRSGDEPSNLELSNYQWHYLTVVLCRTGENSESCKRVLEPSADFLWMGTLHAECEHPKGRLQPNWISCQKVRGSNSFRSDFFDCNVELQLWARARFRARHWLETLNFQARASSLKLRTRSRALPRAFGFWQKSAGGRSAKIMRVS